MTIGALLADVPHTRPIPITSTSEDPAMLDRLRVERSQYEGPTGIVGVLADAAQQAGLPGVSLWAAVPHYAGASPSPKATLALLRRVEEPARRHRAARRPHRAWRRPGSAASTSLAEGDSEVAEYVRTLEQAKDTTDLPEATGEAIAQEFERYLRRRGDGEPPRAGGPGTPQP
ncbi:hypothetical protein GCM10025868_00590 [Angustibacter aerolatus]|uniref:PAC2 family protein n=1 Tax=Angustibacter aerolatus TaxID=1162965 RepID=A0ABQ6JAJ4_9ACTN|nr:hypothetical protein GCM10025868_00590 [Angustibacter aerolatus]